VQEPMTNAQRLAAALEDLAEHTWDSRQQRTEAYSSLVARIEAEHSREPTNTLVLALLAEGLCELESPRARETAMLVLGSEPDPAAAARALCVLADCEDAEEGAGYSAAGIEYCRKALARSPADVKAAVMLADRLYDQGEDSEAKSIMDAALRMNPDSAELLMEAAFIKRVSGPHEEVVAHLLKLEKIKGRQSGNCSRIAVAYAHLGDFAESLMWCRRGQEQEAIEDAKAGRTGRPRSGVHHPALELIIDKAIVARSERPGDPDALCFLAMCFWFLPAIGARLVTDVIVRSMDPVASARFDILAERATLKLNNDLLKGGAFEHVPVTNPWPFGSKLSPLGCMFQSVDVSGDEKIGPEGGH
jgi:tetratricopeptide (TPR) repeat protein